MQSYFKLIYLKKTLQDINKLDTYGPLMALHVTIIIWEIYMVIMVELNLEKRYVKNQTKTGQHLTGFLVWLLSHWHTNFCIFRLFLVWLLYLLYHYPIIPTNISKRIKTISLPSHSWLVSILFVPLVSLDFALLLQFSLTLLSCASNCSDHLGLTTNTKKFSPITEQVGYILDCSTKTLWLWQRELFQ